jgi:hypothetical protein
LKNPVACDPRNKSKNEISWSHILEVAEHDEIVYKLTLKYLREMGYDIGNYLSPKVINSNSK